MTAPYTITTEVDIDAECPDCSADLVCPDCDNHIPEDEAPEFELPIDKASTGHQLQLALDLLQNAEARFTDEGNHGAAKILDALYLLLKEAK